LTRGACGDCRVALPRFDHAVAAGLYAPPLRDAIHALKYRRLAVLARPLGRLAAARVEAAADAVVVPVPAHRRRLRRRGLDHGRLLAAEVASCLDRPLVAGRLRRVRATPPQVGLSTAARRANVTGAFAVDGYLPSATVILVDDVLTTGATASACAVALREVGARSVLVCTVARAYHGPLVPAAPLAYNLPSIPLHRST